MNSTLLRARHLSVTQSTESKEEEMTEKPANAGRLYQGPSGKAEDSTETVSLRHHFGKA